MSLSLTLFNQPPFKDFKHQNPPHSSHIFSPKSSFLNPHTIFLDNIQTSMDTHHQTTHTSPSGHGSHDGVHLCHRCGWPFPNPHPSAKHRRSHKKICGTIEGYTVLIGSEVVSDDEHHSDDDKEHTPSPKIGEIKGSVSRSEDEFADAATEFVDTGSAKQSLDRDLFFSFKDAENADTNEVLNATIEASKVDTTTEVSEKTDLRVEKTEETETKTVGDSSESNLTVTGDLVKDGVVEPTPEPSHVSQSQEAGEGKGQESQTSETITEEAKDSEISKTIPEVSAIVKEETKDGISEEIKQEIKSDCEHVSEVVKESETVEEIKIEKLESDHKHVPEVVKESKIAENVAVLIEKVNLGEPNEHIQEVVKESVAVLTESKDLEAPELEKSSTEQIQEAVKEPVAVLIEKEDLGGAQLEKESIEHNHEVVEKPDSIVTEKDLGTPELEVSSKEQIKEVVKEPDTVLTEKEDLGGPLEKSDSVLTEKQDLGAPELEKCSKDVVIEQEVNNDRVVVADVSTETVALKDSSDDSVTKSKDASGVVPEPVVEEGDVKLMNNQDSGADLTVDSSSHNSLEGTWGSGSVLSTTSIEAETIQLAENSKVNYGKSNAATSDVCEPPSLVETESKDKELGSSEVQPNSEALTEVNNESEGRKKTEEVIEKATNLSTGKQSTPLKNLLGEARSPSGKQPEPISQKDEATVNLLVNDEASSPPKLIEEGKKGKKKGRSSWVPFVCCSSVNAVK